MKTFGKIVDAVLFTKLLFTSQRLQHSFNIEGGVYRRDKVKDLEDRGRLGIRQPQGFSTP